MSLPDHLKHILHEYYQDIQNILGEELDAVVLYGSQARGDATDASDIDVLCIMKKPFDYGDLVLRTGEPSARISLQFDVVISTAFVTRADYENRNTPFLMNVRREAVHV